MDSFDLRTRLDKVGSVCAPFRLGPYVTVRQQPELREGSAIACRVLRVNARYGDLELPTGRAAPLNVGDVIAGVLGNRAALRGFCGRVPQDWQPGEPLALLNKGGVIGRAEGGHAGLGLPTELEVLGVATRGNQPLRLADHALPESELAEQGPPVVAVVGTCMHAGKTTAAAALTRHLRSLGRVVHAGKATGVAAAADLLFFADCGASRTLSFLDCGVPSTCYRDDVPAITRSLLQHLADDSPDVLLLELGDGLMGAYGVDDVLADRRIASRLRGAILAANDVVGAVAAGERLRAWGIEVLAVIGPATDNAAGTGRLHDLGWPAVNVLAERQRFCDTVTGHLFGISP